MYDNEKMMKRMIEGKLYIAQPFEKTQKSRALVQKYNTSTESPVAKMQYLREAFGAMGENSYIEAPFYCDHGWNIYTGKNFYANTGFLVLDQCPVTIGDNVFIGPRVSILCATHPIDAYVRNLQLEGGKPVTIGNDVWIGGNVTINGGVTIGNNVVIGSGSVVVKDIPDNSIAVGNPCKVLRAITEKDHLYWIEQMAEFENDMGKINP